MTQLDFDFKDFQERVGEQQRQALEEAAEGLKALEGERDEVCDKIALLEERRDDLDSQIERLRKFLAIDTPLARLQVSRPRPRGLQKAIIKTAFGEPAHEATKPLVSDWLDLEDITVLAKESFPTAHEVSVRDALRHLVRKGQLEVRGARGSREWRACSKDWEQSPLAQQPEASEESAPPVFGADGEKGIPMAPSMGHVIHNAFREISRRARQSPQSQRDESGIDESDTMMVRNRLCSSILEELAKRPAGDGLDAKAIAWLIDKEQATESDFKSAVQTLLKAKEVVLAPGCNGGGQVVCLPIDPDSREGLKRIHVQGNSLFPGMEQPDHI
jgi:hypothetical protein